MGDVRRLTKNGHSVGINIPTEVLKAVKLAPGDPIMIEVVDGSIVLSRALSSRQLFEREPKTASKRHA